ncbi:MAG: L-glyceraldehyde 3-phosphate reductase [Candidatus Cyclobacteriaceae bacterium M3_2C_046]
MIYQAAKDRYETMKYNRCGKSGVKLPVVSLGLWHNFGDVENFEKGREIIRRAFDLGITHLDLANNYGPPYGTAEENFGRMMQKDLRPYRDQLFISSKAGFDMWPGPYGDWGSRKYLVASCDQSLKRMQMDYVDLFYSHRFDPETPLEETMGALDYIVRSGRALYAGISNYPPEQTRKAVEILNKLGTPCLIHQMKYSMFERTPEQGLFDELEKNGVGGIAFSPLAQGLLTNKYLKGIPEDSRAGKSYGYLWPEHVTEERVKKVRQLNEMAEKRGQSMAQMALSWILRNAAITSVLIGASSVNQLEANIDCTKNLDFDQKELEQVDQILGA